MALMVLVARRLAMRRAAHSPIGGRGRLHVRLVAFFSIIASVPTLLVVIFASMLFQSGVKFWFSDRAQTVLDNAEDVAQIYREEHRDGSSSMSRRWAATSSTGSTVYGIDIQAFATISCYQTAARQLTKRLSCRSGQTAGMADAGRSQSRRPAA